MTSAWLTGKGKNPTETMRAWTSPLGRLRREYFRQEEDKGRPPRHPAQLKLAEQRGFSLGGHRLSSPYRIGDYTASKLRVSKHLLASSWQKYSVKYAAKRKTSGDRT